MSFPPELIHDPDAALNIDPSIELIHDPDAALNIESSIKLGRKASSIDVELVHDMKADIEIVYKTKAE